MNDETLIISGGTVVCEHAVLPDHDVYVRNGRIAAIRPSAHASTLAVRDGAGASADAPAHVGEPALGANPPAQQRDLVDSAQTIIDEALSAEAAGGEALASMPMIVDARGTYVAPGMIDVHSDYIESVASPRPSVVMDFRTSLVEADRELAAHGITTMFHSLSVYRTSVFDHKPIRSFENVIKLIEEVSRAKRAEEKAHLIRHRLHVRVELDSVDRYDEIKRLVEEGRVDMLSFMDHTPGQGQYSDLALFGETLKGYRDLTNEDVAEIIEMQQKSDKLTLGQMAELARLAHAKGIAVSSHDDDSCAKLDCMEALGVAISEFPISLDVAESARARGMHTLAGAPNVVMGRSHSGNLSAREAVAAGAIDMLCSDYYPAALLEAVFVLHHAAKLDLAEAFALVSAHPAKAAGIDDEIGSIAVGKRADLIMVRELPVSEEASANAVPVVTDAFVGGRCIHRSRYPLFSEHACESLDFAADRYAAELAVAHDDVAQTRIENVQVAR